MNNKSKIWCEAFAEAMKKYGDIKEKTDEEKREVLKNCIIEANSAELVIQAAQLVQTHGLPKDIVLDEAKQYIDFRNNL